MSGIKQTRPGKQFPQLLHPDRKNIPARINQQNQVIPFPEFVSQAPLNLPAQTPGIVPFDRFSEFTGKSKSYPVVWQPVPAH